MSNKKLTIRNTPSEILEAIEKEHGIQIIRDFVKKHNKKERNKSIRVNYYDEVSKDVYNLMMNYSYSKGNAIDAIAIERDRGSHTIKAHCSKFDKEAKEFDYYSFGVLVDELKEDIYIGGYMKTPESIGESNGIDAETARIYYYKYKNSKKKQNVNIDKFKRPRQQQQQYQPQYK
jgi:hypothetical protein